VKDYMYTQQIYHSELNREPILSIWRKIQDREEEGNDETETSHSVDASTDQHASDSE
jgi:hypothetical protein